LIYPRSIQTTTHMVGDHIKEKTIVQRQYFCCILRGNQDKDFYLSAITTRPMKTIAIGSILAVFAVMAIGPAFADHPTTEISIPAGSATPGCEATNECYIPSEVTIDAGSEVVWSNDDSASHTVTSGNPKDGPDGIFDSGLFLSGQTFSRMFEEEGEFPYFCLVHPWMQGAVIVQAETEHAEEEPTNGETAEGEHESSGAMVMSQDGSIMVLINSDEPAEGTEAMVTVEFVDAEQNPIEHVNFDIAVTQDGNEVLSESGLHAMSGITEFTTAALGSESPLDVQVTIQGIGTPDSDPETWTGPKGETVSAQVVPEFGPLAMVILAVAIVSIVAVTARSKVIPRL